MKSIGQCGAEAGDRGWMAGGKVCLKKSTPKNEYKQ